MNIIDLIDVKDFLDTYDYDKVIRDIRKIEDDISKNLMKLSKDYGIDITNIGLRSADYGVRLNFKV